MTRMQAAWRLLRLCGVPVGTAGAREVAWFLAWLAGQQPKVLSRFDPGRNDEHTREPVHDESYWWTKLCMYHHRAAQLGLESPEGRQVVFELAATAAGWCASIVRVYGQPSSASDDFRAGVTGLDAMTKP